MIRTHSTVLIDIIWQSGLACFLLKDAMRVLALTAVKHSSLVETRWNPSNGRKSLLRHFLECKKVYQRVAEWVQIAWKAFGQRYTCKMSWLASLPEKSDDSLTGCHESCLRDHCCVVVKEKQVMALRCMHIHSQIGQSAIQMPSDLPLVFALKTKLFPNSHFSF